MVCSHMFGMLIVSQALGEVCYTLCALTLLVTSATGIPLYRGGNGSPER